MEWISGFESSNVSKIAYEDGSLYVEFHHGGTYQYFDVPQHIFDEFSSAASKGQFLAHQIKGHFRYSRV